MKKACELWNWLKTDLHRTTWKLTVAFLKISAIFKKFFFDSYGRKPMSKCFQKIFIWRFTAKTKKQPYWNPPPSRGMVKSLQAAFDKNPSKAFQNWVACQNRLRTTGGMKEKVKKHKWRHLVYDFDDAILNYLKKIFLQPFRSEPQSHFHKRVSSFLSSCYRIATG
jgi:hypothetical protein